MRDRKRVLAKSGRVYQDLARQAGVSYSMAYKWMNAERKSAKLAQAFQALTGVPE